MLTELHIRNFAIVQSLDLIFEKGMSALTGETGAGKSILIDAIELALGERADNRWIRENELRCEITLCFDVKNHLFAKQWLCENDLDAEDDCVIRRVLSSDGRSRCYINDQSVSLQSLKVLGASLLTIHGQHHNRLLFEKSYQRQLLDHYLNHASLIKQVKQSYETWHELEQAAKILQEKSNEAQTKLDFLAYQLNEFEALKVEPNEYEKLESEQKKLSHSERLLKDSELALQKISTVGSEIFKTQSILKPLLTISNYFENINVLLENAAIQIQEAQHDLENYLGSFSLEPDQLLLIEQRLSDIYSLARKYRVTPSELNDLYLRLLAERDEIGNLDAQIAQLNHEIQSAKHQYEIAASQLSEQRQVVAKQLSQAVQVYLPDLGMKHAQFQIQLVPTEPSIFGSEQVSFWMQTNVGQTLQPLEKIVSGGELSRLNLAIQAVFTHAQESSVLIFDEIDTGIGGSVAALVGQLIHLLSKHVQVIAITHLPQVAAKADHHYLVEKSVFENKTSSTLEKLSIEKRIEEMARMLGGLKITDKTRAHARELLEI